MSLWAGGRPTPLDQRPPTRASDCSGPSEFFFARGRAERRLRPVRSNRCAQVPATAPRSPQQPGRPQRQLPFTPGRGSSTPTNRMTMRNHSVGEKAAPSTPSTKTEAVIKMTGRRPIVSESLPEASAPTAAPTNSSPVTSSLSNELNVPEACVQEEQRTGDDTGVVAEEQAAQRRNARCPDDRSAHRFLSGVVRSNHTRRCDRSSTWRHTHGSLLHIISGESRGTVRSCSRSSSSLPPPCHLEPTGRGVAARSTYSDFASSSHSVRPGRAGLQLLSLAPADQQLSDQPMQLAALRKCQLAAFQSRLDFTIVNVAQPRFSAVCTSRRRRCIG
jgi:hypothetical protein